MSDERLDIIVFGATGFTGKYAVTEVLRLAKEKGNLTWGISGRNKQKLDSLLDEVSKKTGEDLSKIPVIIADIGDYDSVLNMTAKAKVVVNCAGPYRFYGEPVVKACITNGTHQVDVTGEPQFMERMVLEYGEAAREKGVYIVNSCGFDCIPSEMGSIFLQKHFDGDVNSIEIYFAGNSDSIESGAAIHYGTWESAVYGLAHSNELRSLRSKLFPTRLPHFSPKLRPRSVIHRNEFINGWCLPFPGCDKSVIYRSQRHFYEHDKKRPIQVATYAVYPSLISLIAVLMLGAVFFILTKCNFGRKLLLKYPRFFSGGFISHEGPSEEAADKHEAHLTLIGEGWNEKLSEPTDKHTMPPNKKLIVKVKTVNPGYRATCAALVLSAITILKEKDKMPQGGGVFAPGAAFAKTSLLEELFLHGKLFETEILDVPMLSKL